MEGVSYNKRNGAPSAKMGSFITVLLFLVRAGLNSGPVPERLGRLDWYLEGLKL